MRRSLMLSLVVLLCTPLLSQPKLIIVLRADDIMSRNTTVLPRSITSFEAAAEQRGAKVTWVTIPHRLIEPTNADGSITRELKASLLKGHEVAQHGYNHICTRCSQTGHEMWCASQGTAFTYAEQQSMVASGLDILADSLGIVPTAFVSPGHQEDSTTYHVLVDRGFQYISTPRTPTKTDAIPGLFNLAHHAEYTWSLTEPMYRRQLDSALAHVQQRGMADGYFAFLFHDYFIRQGYLNGIVVRWLGELLDSLTSRYGSMLEFRTLSEAASHFRNLTTVADRTPVLPTQTLLLGNYPNPFNQSTTVTYHIPASSRATLEVFDVLGRRVATLLAAELEPGHYSSAWNADISSGVYYVRLETTPLGSPGKRAAVTRMVNLIR